MSLRRKLSGRIALIFGSILGFVFLGVYLLFERQTNDTYYKKLLDRSHTAAYYYLEKDEWTKLRYLQVEQKYRKITHETIRLYDAHSFKMVVTDSLDFRLPVGVLKSIVSKGSYFFRINDRQLAGIYYTDNEGDFIIIASGINMYGISQLATLRWTLISFFIMGLVLTYLMTGWLATKTFKPFSSLIKKVNSITAENLHTRLETIPGKSDELTEVITTFNYFLERLEESIKEQRSFLKNASHELKTPLAVIIGDIDVALSRPRDQDAYISLLRSLKKDTLHLNSIVEGLLLLSGLKIAGEHKTTPLSIDDILWNVLEKVQAEYPASSVTVDFGAMEQHQQLLTVSGNKELLFIALSNVVDNAVKYSQPEPVSIVVKETGNQLHIIITDKGPGIREAERELIFELFYRSNQTRHISGHGIGLHLTRQILNLYNISLHISTPPDQQGTIVHLTFP